MFKFLFSLSILFINASFAGSCALPSGIDKLVTTKGLNNLKQYPDIRRNYNNLRGLCVNLVSFREGIFKWKMLLIFNPNAPKGAFWFLPHDNENSAFDSAVYATKKYGGGFLAVQTGGSRYYKGQDPNRNFSNSNMRVCKGQLASSPIYTSTVFEIIDSFKAPSMPYLALHNNTNGGGISALKSTSKVKSYLAYPKEVVKKGVGLADEDSIVYIAGVAQNPSAYKLNRLLKLGLNVRYEIVNSSNNDCSMSNYVVLEKGSTNYYNIEAQHGKTKIQKQMINLLLGGKK